MHFIWFIWIIQILFWKNMREPSIFDRVIKYLEPVRKITCVDKPEFLGLIS